MGPILDEVPVHTKEDDKPMGFQVYNHPPLCYTEGIGLTIMTYGRDWTDYSDLPAADRRPSETGVSLTGDGGRTGTHPTSSFD